jgi:hypothetical protein
MHEELVALLRDEHAMRPAVDRDHRLAAVEASQRDRRHPLAELQGHVAGAAHRHHLVAHAFDLEVRLHQFRQAPIDA